MERPDLDLSSTDTEDKQGFPWLIIIGILGVMLIAGAWIMHTRSNTAGSVAALEQLLTAQKAVIDEERQQVFDLTTQLESMKHAMAQGQTDKLKAVDAYNKVAEQQRKQREKVKILVEEYNLNVAKLHELQ